MTRSRCAAVSCGESTALSACAPSRCSAALACSLRARAIGAGLEAKLRWLLGESVVERYLARHDLPRARWPVDGSFPRPSEGCQLERSHADDQIKPAPQYVDAAVALETIVVGHRNGLQCAFDRLPIERADPIGHCSVGQVWQRLSEWATMLDASEEPRLVDGMLFRQSLVDRWAPGPVDALSSFHYCDSLEAIASRLPTNDNSFSPATPGCIPAS